MAVATARAGTPGTPTLDSLSSDGKNPLRVDAAGRRSLAQTVNDLASEGLDARAPGSGRLLVRFRENARRLAEAHRRLSALTAAGVPVPAESEWLLDNYYVVGEVVREVRTDLPRGYYRELPAIATGPLTGLPRVYPLAAALLAYTDSALTEAAVRDAVRAYQDVVPLSTGELWALPTMLRLGLLENLRRLADQILATLDARHGAAAAVSAAKAGRQPPLPDEPSDAFAAGVVDTLRDQDPGPGPAADALRRWANLYATDLTEIRHREYCRQAANQVSIGNAVTSLRLLGVIDWTTFVEAVSLVEARLRTDPGGVYPKQDFITRDRCRRAVEQLARGSGLTETDVAQSAVAAAARRDGDPVRGQVAWVLLGDGRREFERAIQYRPKWDNARKAWLVRHPYAVYFGLLGGVAAAVLAAAALVVGATTPAVLAAVLVLGLLPASEAAVALVNFTVCRLLPPTVLPRLDFKTGIADDCTTILVVPTLIARPEQAGGLVEKLEQHYLANPDPRLLFALLTDFTDAPAEAMPTDEACVRALLDGVARLNARHRPNRPPAFFVLHRRRAFNPAEGCWMGWERKRGKLAEFNRLLRGARDTTYATVSPGFDTLPPVRFVLTLDSDTVLPRDAARQMIAALAHPLNRPRLSADGRRVEAGYALLQPRVSFLYRTGFRSWFSRLFAGSAGIDPYSAAVSDTYMDLFGRGTFTGKGLYDVDAFEATAGRAFPDNHVLSHDLIESNYARCALATDVEVFDEFPAKYHAYAKREHRWVRGDWQLLPWLGPTVPTPDGRARNPLPPLERWKVIDNMRRSLVPPAMVALLVLGWVALPGPAWAWTALALLPLFLPAILFVVETGLAAARGAPAHVLYARTRADLTGTVGQAALQLAFLPHQAWLAADAIARTLYRLYVSHRRLLEWETAAATEARLGTTPAAFARMMWPTVVTALAAGAAAAALAPWALVAAGPVLLLWLAAPGIAYAVSRPRDVSEPPLTDAQRTELRAVARTTWDFFETFVGPEDNWLPPDNYQESPLGVVAHRTSPTNVGLYLLSTLTAHDFGYLTTAELLHRLGAAFDALERLPRYRGHFLNWYETNTLAVLLPRYVSTVDSGNLLASLLALKHGVREAARPRPPACFGGLADTLAVLRRYWDRAAAATDAGHKATQAIRDAEGVLREPDPPTPEETVARLSRVQELAELIAAAVRGAVTDPAAGTVRWADRFATLAARHRAAADALPPPAAAFETLAARADWLAAEMDFRFLYNPDRELFAIGYNADTDRLDPSHYDLLASEACIASFLAVARGQVSRKHWFQLGRLTTRAGGELGLVSWGGTMFEYLMPRLLLPAPRGVLLDQIQRSAVRRQVEYGREIGLPWGISESGFYLFDAGQVYQYQSFGVPGLGLKRGLERDRVIAPYATLLAVDVDPPAALANLARLRREGGEGPYGFYEALDYTRDRVAAAGATHEVVRSYMAHHQGMAFLAIANRLTGGVVRRWLRAEPAVRAAELILEERVPYDAPVVEPEAQAPAEPHQVIVPEYPVRRRITTPDTPAPRTHLLSNGRYTVMLTNAGGGFSRCRDLDVTRWRADPTTDAYGQFVYVRDCKSGAAWSAGYQPTRKRPAEYEATFALDKADIRRVDDGIETLLEVTVVPDQDIEVRRVTLHNVGTRTRELDATSYVEVVLNPHAADLAHPAFGKLFLETEWVPNHNALLCRRRPRADDQTPVWAVHVLATDAPSGDVSWETDRGRFLGRRRTPADPAALAPGVEDLSGTTGPVLDPVLAIRRRVRIKPGGRVTVAFTTGVAPTRPAAVAMADQYCSLHAVTRAFELAWAHARIEVQHTQLRAEDAHLYQRLAGHLIYPIGSLRADPDVLAANRLGQPALWPFGISGDNPIALARLHGPGGTGLVRQLLSAHSYWQAKGLRADLLFLLENAGGYADELFTEVMTLVRDAGYTNLVDRPGGVFVRKGWQMAEPDRILLLAAARVVLDDRNGLLAEQVDAVAVPRPLPARRQSHPAVEVSHGKHGERCSGLVFANGVGGFSPDGLEYVICSNPAHVPPAPWANVIANPRAGFLVTDGGGGFAWAGNSQTNRLTPWSNDPVSDPPGDVVYLQDEATGAVWCPTPLPVPDGGPVTARHGQGYTVFERTVDGLAHELTVFVPPADPVKVSVLKVTNTGRRPRRLAVAYAVEWVLGTTRDATAQSVVTELDPETGAVFARNAFNPDFGSAVAFADCSLRPRTVTADRTEFLGRNGSPAAPAALDRVALSGRTGPGLDPCAAVRGTIALAPGEERVIVFVLGEAADDVEARRLVTRYDRPEAADAALQAVVEQWDQVCGTVRVRTPDPAFDLLMNRWLVYQTLSCRVWGRSAFYQSGGAYGFRDQLQDVLALLHAAPAEARAQILRSAAHQFVEGDVQHWWHEPAGNGIRTRFSDDFLWLPYAACQYAEVTGDAGVWDETVPFLTAPPLAPDQQEVYGVPSVAAEAGTVYEHCVRALNHGWQLGPHGLPLMGSGDWNDGMNAVGAGGRGESVWVAWFQIVCLSEFAGVADRRGDAAFAATCRSRVEHLRGAVERSAWDGGWYRRAYFDDGTPLGSALNDECQIDSIAQSWAVIAGDAAPARAGAAMDAVVRRLVRPADRLILLFDPPFDAGPLRPGYIKGYVPGVRENGGQYTHAATWVVKALADLGRRADAFAAFALINPVRSTDTPAGVERYRGEPYVVAGDVYGRPPHVGRAGWTWYTGSAAWLYRVGLEDILGFRRTGSRLRIEPCIPSDWSGFEVRYRFGQTVYRIEVINGPATTPTRVTVDGVEVADGAIPLIDDGRERAVSVQLGAQQKNIS